MGNKSNTRSDFFGAHPNFSPPSSRIALVYQSFSSHTIADCLQYDWIAEKKLVEKSHLLSFQHLIKMLTLGMICVSYFTSMDLSRPKKFRHPVVLLPFIRRFALVRQQINSNMTGSHKNMTLYQFELNQSFCNCDVSFNLLLKTLLLEKKDSVDQRQWSLEPVQFFSLILLYQSQFAIVPEQTD